MKRINPVKYLDRKDKDLIASLNSLIDKINQLQSASDNHHKIQISDAILKAEKLSSSTPDEHPYTCATEIRVLINELKELQVKEAKRKDWELQVKEAKRKEEEARVTANTSYHYSPPTPKKYRFDHSFKVDGEYDKLRSPHDLYYITHFDNALSISKNGIFSRNLLAEQNILFTNIGDLSVLEQRKCKICNGKNLWSYANVYFNPRNAMLYRIKNTYGDKTGILKVELDLNSPDLWITDGNAANNVTKFFPSDRRDEILPKIQKETIGVKWFNESKEVERKVQAECLVLKQINPNCIKSIHVSKNSNFINEWERLVKDSGLPVIPEEDMFFE